MNTNMHNKKTIILNSNDVVTNRKMLINKMIDKHIQENDYDVEKIFNANLQVKKNVLDSLIDYNFDEVKQIEK